MIPADSLYLLTNNPAALAIASADADEPELPVADEAEPVHA